MPRNLDIALLILIIFSTILPNIDSRVAFHLTNVKCICIQRDFCKITLCQLKAVKRGVQELSVGINLLKLPINNVTFDFGFTRRFDAQNQRVIGGTIDACAFWRNKRRNPLVELLFNILEWTKYSNMNHSCPYNHDILIKGFHINKDYIKLLPLPGGQYNAYMKWSAYNVHRITLSFTLQLVKD